MMINTGLVWRSKSLSPANINHHVPLDDGRHTSQLMEHARGHRLLFFSSPPFTSASRDPLALPEYISSEEDLFRACKSLCKKGDIPRVDH